MTANQISVYSLNDLKNTTDDALPNYLTSLKFKQNHFLTDVRLTLGYVAVAIAGITFYFDHKLGWDATKEYTFHAVIAYFILNGALTVWIWAIEKGKVFSGEKNGTLISFASHTTKHTPVYSLTVRYCTHDVPSFDWEERNISAPFTRWFTSDGFFVAQPFQQWLASEIEVVGIADQKNADLGKSSAEEKVEDTVVVATPGTRSRKTKK